MGLTKYKLGKLIEQCNNRNTDEEYTADDVRGISTGKEFIETKANMDGVSLTSYKIVKENEFAYVADTSRRGDKIAVAFNRNEGNILISSIYTVFYVSKPELLLSDYLFMFFNRSEFDRYSRFNSWGSARETFSWEDMCDMEVDLPPLSIQQKYVDIYNAMLANQQSYERGLEDLKLVCDAYIDDLRKKLSHRKLGSYISMCENKNDDLVYGIDAVRGVSIEKKFIDTKANMEGVSLKPYEIVNPNEFAYVTVTSRNGEKISLARNNSNEVYICSSSYIVFKVNDRFQFSSGLNVFNIVYESSIRNRIIANSENVDPTIVINVLRELAFYMHFGKKNYVGIDEITNVVETYKKNYRQKVNIRFFIDATIRAKILVDVDDEIRFKDHTLVAYFVAQALNQKYHQDEDINDYLDYLLKNLCFSINSDIVLFLALITNNPKFINVIINGAIKHFEKKEELSFDAENIKFLLDTTIPVKNSLPNEEERKQRDEVLAKQEEDAKFSDLIELVNEYDYSEEDLLKIENQIMISFKYLEILSKTLPAFCQNMKVEQQDVLVSLIYRCPNQFLFDVLKDIGDNFEAFCNEVYEDISALRQEKNIAEVNINSVKHMIEQISAVLVMALYQVVAATSSSEQTITALNEFNYNSNSNYKLQNLMMISRVADVTTFSRRAQELNRELENKIEKSIIKYTVREYLLRNNVEIYGEAQSLIDCFFGGQTSQKLKMEIAKKRIIEKDRT